MQKNWATTQTVNNCFMDKNHDCATIISKVFLALDGALSPDEEKDFLDEINKCDRCLEQYDIAQTFKKFLSTKVKRHAVKPALIAEIKEKMKAIAVE